MGVSQLSHPDDLASSTALKLLDGLPFLGAIVTETLRLNAPIPGPQPRILPEGTFLEGHGPLPAGMRVSSNAWCLHRNEQVFPQAEKWVPDRWLSREDGDVRGEHLKEMQRWFWAFGSGGRMCVGSNFALLGEYGTACQRRSKLMLLRLEMKAILAAIYTNFRTEIVDASGIEQQDGYTVGPKEDLVLRFIKVQT
jgi:hypothetical protein